MSAELAELAASAGNYTVVQSNMNMGFYSGSCSVYSLLVSRTGSIESTESGQFTHPRFHHAIPLYQD